MPHYRLVMLVLCTLLALLQYRLWLSEGGLRDVYALGEAISTQRAANDLLSERNAALAAEVKDLKEGLEAIEERARTELGMIRQGEVFYRVVSK